MSSLYLPSNQIEEECSEELTPTRESLGLTNQSPESFTSPEKNPPLPSSQNQPDNLLIQYDDTIYYDHQDSKLAAIVAGAEVISSLNQTDLSFKIEDTKTINTAENSKRKSLNNDGHPDSNLNDTINIKRLSAPEVLSGNSETLSDQLDSKESKPVLDMLNRKDKTIDVIIYDDFGGQKKLEVKPNRTVHEIRVSLLKSMGIFEEMEQYDIFKSNPKSHSVNEGE
jgi:hypothetical protein